MKSLFYFITSLLLLSAPPDLYAQNIKIYKKTKPGETPTDPPPAQASYLTSQDIGTDISYTLSQPASVGFAILDTVTGAVKRHYNAEPKAAGTYSVPTWDLKDNDGNTVFDYTNLGIEIIAHQIVKTWDGVALNHSTQKSNITWEGSEKHNSYYGGGIGVYENPSNGWVYYCTGMGENNVTLRKFHINDPNKAVYMKRTASLLFNEAGGEKLGALPSIYHLTGDGQYLYVPAVTWQSATANVQNNYVFIMRFDLSTDIIAPFSSGTDIAPGTFSFPGVIVLKSNLPRFISFTYNFTGVAVDNNYLYTAQGETNNSFTVSNGDTTHYYADNRLRVFNKSTGAQVSQTDSGVISRPRGISADGSGIWVIHGTNSLSRFPVSSGVISTTPSITLSGLLDPLTTSIQTVGGTQYIYVTDGGASQQVKRYRTSDGAADNTFNSGSNAFGQAGGYVDNTIVTDSRFFFDKSHGKKPGINVKPDGTFWLCDDGNNRMLRMTSAFTKTHDLQFSGATYGLFMAAADTGRIMVNWMEYEVGYNGEITQDWKLLRQFGASLPAEAPQTGEGAVRLSYVQQLSNGSRYAGYITNETQRKHGFVELTDYGLRYITSFGQMAGFYSADDPIFSRELRANGNMYISSRSTDDGTRSLIYEYPLTGFTNVTWKGQTYQNPVWSATRSVVLNRPRNVNDVHGAMFGVQEGNAIIFDPDKPNNSSDLFHRSYHLGAIPYGSSAPVSYKWQAAKSVENPKGAAYPDARFEIGNDINYAASRALPIGDIIHWHYYGENWNGGQTNMHHIVDKRGIQLFQHGLARANATANTPKGWPEMGGNGKRIEGFLSASGDRYYIWQGEEGYHCGVLRFRYDGLNSLIRKRWPVKIPN